MTRKRCSVKVDNDLFLFSLLVIAEITLLFDESRLEIALGLSLTVMLVMYTFYQVSTSPTICMNTSFTLPDNLK